MLDQHSLFVACTFPFSITQYETGYATCLLMSQTPLVAHFICNLKISQQTHTQHSKELNWSNFIHCQWVLFTEFFYCFGAEMEIARICSKSEAQGQPPEK